MDPAQFKEIMDTISKSRSDLEVKIHDLKKDMHTVQEKTSHDLMQRISQSNYQFKHKGNEVQFNFNSGVEESISSACRELKKITPTEDKHKEALKKADMFLDKDMKSLEKRQKHIKVADRSDFGWSTVEHYEKHLEKAEREAERAANKRKWGGRARVKRKRSWNDTGGPSNRRESQPVQTVAPPPLLLQGQFRPHVLGPCFGCGRFGHLAKTCPKNSVYPFNQPVVSSAEVSCCVAESIESQGVNSMVGACVDSTKSLTPALA